MSGYYEEVSAKYTLLLREMLKGMPPFMREFFNGMADRTTARTRLGYASDAKVFFEYLVKEAMGFDKGVRELTLADLGRVTKRDLSGFMEYLDYYVSGEGEGALVHQNHALAKSRKLTAIRTLYRYFQREEKLDRNPAEVMDNPCGKDKPIVYLEQNEMARLLDIVESGEGLTPRQQCYHEYTMTRDLAIITLMLGTGMRVSECAGIDVNHIDFENSAIRISRKGGGEAFIYYGDETETALYAYLDVREEMKPLKGHENALFLSLQNKRLNVRSIQNLVKKYAGIVTSFKNITPHKLRSTFGTNLYRETGDIYLVADVLGHKSVETTRKHYASMSDQNRRKAARVIKLRDEQP